MLGVIGFSLLGVGKGVASGHAAETAALHVE